MNGKSKQMSEGDRRCIDALARGDGELARRAKEIYHGSGKGDPFDSFAMAASELGKAKFKNEPTNKGMSELATKKKPESVEYFLAKSDWDLLLGGGQKIRQMFFKKDDLNHFFGCPEEEVVKIRIFRIG